MTKNGFKSFLMMASVLTLTACASTERLAKTALLKPASSVSSKVALALAPVVDYGASSGYGSGGGYTVLSGDTIEGIAWQYKLDPADILRVNRLSASAQLAPGMRLQLPLPEIYRVRRGDTLALVARMFAVSERELARTNNLNDRRLLTVGQHLTLPQLNRGGAATAAEKAPEMARVLAENVLPVGVLGTLPATRRGGEVVLAETLPPMTTTPMPPQAQMSRVAGAGMMTVPLRKPDIHPVSLPAPTPEPELSDILPPRSGSAFLRPVSGSVISRFGAKPDGRYNEGINIAAPKGTPVRAAEAGRVVYVGNAVEGYGNLILVKHTGGYITAYAHLDKSFARTGQVVKRGHTLGTVGSTGSVERAQLHFEIRKGRESLDPAGMI